MKILKRMLFIILVAVTIEAAFFQGTAIYINYLSGHEKIAYTLNDANAVNWTKSVDGLYSEPDPMLTFPRADVYVASVYVKAITDARPTSIQLFYTDTEGTLQTKEDIVTTDDAGKGVMIFVNEYVQALRVDLGEEANLVLYDLDVRLNEIPIRVSISRIILIIAVYWTTIGLFSLQKKPKYLIEGKK